MPNEDYIPFEHINYLHIRCLFEYMRTDRTKLEERAYSAGCTDAMHYKCTLEQIMGMSGAWRGGTKPQKIKIIERFLDRWEEFERQKKLMSDPMF